MSTNRILSNKELTAEEKLAASMWMAKTSIASSIPMDNMPSSVASVGITFLLALIIEGVVELVDQADSYIAQASFPRFWTITESDEEEALSNEEEFSSGSELTPSLGG